MSLTLRPSKKALEAASTRKPPKPSIKISALKALSNKPKGIAAAANIAQQERNKEIESTPEVKLPSSLLDANITLDESQERAVSGLVTQKYGCLMGAAGTGKTTCTKALIERLNDSIATIDIGNYFNIEADAKDRDDYVRKMKAEKLVTSIALCAFTGKASEQIKKNFPESWHSNIMTIHRLLAFRPVYYTDLNEEGQMVNKRRFEPAYNEFNKLPWDVIVIDEAGMVPVELWHQLLDACEERTRIIMIGDINQLPPVHGASIFGYALSQWPRYQLTRIHRQTGENNPIVENAWKILRGEMPEEMPGFKMVKLNSRVEIAAKQVQGAMITLKDANIFDPIRDTAIVPINGNPDSKGMELGQQPMNQFLALQFNPDEQRYLIDGGREKRGFAIGDKVMVTKNDHERALTNGMTGVITSITLNGDYAGDMDAVGPIEQVNAKVKMDSVSFEDLMDGLSQREVKEKVAELARGQASHIVEVEFGHGKFSFATFGEVTSLQLAYVITGHKSQGSEYPTVIIAVHDAHKMSLYREWLYTVVTRSSDKVVLMYTGPALSGALRKQKIDGNTMEEKIKKFIRLAANPFKGTPRLPKPQELEA